MTRHAYDEWRTRWPALITQCDTDKAVDLVRRYFASLTDGRPAYTGSRFERVAALNEDPNTLAPADFVAVSMLSVDVPAAAAIRILGPEAANVSELLHRIPTDLDIVDADPDELVSGSAASELWALLRRARDGVGRTTTSKLMAAKRPRLIPIWDSRVEEATGLDTDAYWRRFQEVLVADDRRIWLWLSTLRGMVADLPDGVSELRILDVLLWMSVAGR